jgi:tetratricopeptide (TPR) repeat protein
MSLFEIESYVLLGHYQAAINAAGSLKTNDSQLKLQRDILLHRAHIEQGDHILSIEEIRDDAPPALLAIKYLAQFVASKNLDEAHAKAQALVPKAAGDPNLQLALGLLFFRLNKLEDALKVLHNCNVLEARALTVQLFLVLNRLDLASKELSRLQSIKDDAIATQLASAWVATFAREKLKDAIETYQELIDKYGPSVPLLNGLAVAQMHAGVLDKAEKALKDALVIDSKNALTQINLFVCYEHQAKPQDILKRQLTLIKSLAPDHPWLLSVSRAEEHFDATVAKFEQDLKAAATAATS